MSEIDGIGFGAFIVPGLIMLSLLNQSISNASFGIYMPKFSGTIYEVLSAPISAVEIVLGYVGAAATKSVLPGALTLLFWPGLRIPPHPMDQALGRRTKPLPAGARDPPGNGLAPGLDGP
jgi:hypothetical protein